MTQYEYFINLDERGEFNADVRHPVLGTIWQTDGDVFEDGFMKHKLDLFSLRRYLIDLGLIGKDDILARGN